MSREVFCSRCGTQLSSLEKHCGRCGTQNAGAVQVLPAHAQGPPRPAGRGGKVVLVVAGLILALAVLGSLGRSGSSAQLPNSVSTTTPRESIKTPQVRLQPAECLDFVAKARGVVDEYSTKITGAIKNNCGRDFRYVQVSFKLLDSSGATVGRAFANIAGLSEGETWKFQAHGFTPAVRFDTDGDITAR
jgi:hypothetical protein